MARVNRLAEVNAALRARGEMPRLRRALGGGYYYFDGPATAWPSSGVYVNRADALSVADWLAEFDRLKAARG